MSWELLHKTKNLFLSYSFTKAIATVAIHRIVVTSKFPLSQLAIWLAHFKHKYQMFTEAFSSCDTWLLCFAKT